MSNGIYTLLTLTKPIILKPNEISSNLDEIIKNKLRNEYEGKCMSEGYIKDDSIKILKRTIGFLESFQFKGIVTYNVTFNADICNPMSGMIVKSRITNINKLGLLLENGPLLIIVPREYHDNKNIFKDLQIGDDVEIEIIGKKYNLNSINISVIARLTNNIKKTIISIKKKHVKDKKKLDNTIPSTIPSKKIYKNSELFADENEKELVNDFSLTGEEKKNITGELGEEETEDVGFQMLDEGKDYLDDDNVDFDINLDEEVD